MRGRIVSRDDTGAGKVIRGVLEDVTKRKNIERAHDRLMRFYATLSETNQAVIYVTDERKLLRTICDTAIEHGAADAVWIGFENDDGMLLSDFAQGSGIDGFLAERRELLEDPSCKMLDLPSIAVHDNRPVWLRADRVLPRDKIGIGAVARGWRSAASVPLRRRGIARGALTFYSYDPDNFDQDLDGLLREMAGDISFALDNLQDRRDQLRLREDLKASERRLREILDQSVVGVYVVEGTQIVYANHRTAAVLGYSQSSDVIGLNLSDVIAAGDRIFVEEQVRRLVSGLVASIEVRFSYSRPTGEIVQLVSTSVIGTFDGRPARFGIVHELND